MRLPPPTFVVLDTETTGFVPRTHRVIEYAAVRAQGGEVTDTYESLFAIDQEIPPHVQVLTRIRPEMLQGKPTFDEERETMVKLLESADMLVGQNLGFDLGMLRGEGIDLTDKPWVDTSMLASLVYPEFRSYSLPYMSRVLNLTHEPAHRALGDVRATLELLGHIWERLMELPAADLAHAKDIMGRSSVGYKMLFDALPASVSKRATWMTVQQEEKQQASTGSLAIAQSPVGTVTLHEEGLAASCLQDIVNASAADDSCTHWIAVKNLESALHKLTLPPNVRAIHPAPLLLNPSAAADLEKQASFLPEEATLALKISWFHPRTRNDVSIHGNEKDIWLGRLTCAETDPTYTSQFTQAASVYLIDHRQLLWFLADPTHAAHGAMKPSDHIIIDDASMLEDTATKAYGHYLSIDSLRAASHDPQLKRFTDLLALWCERIRIQEDMHFLTAQDYGQSETDALRTLLADILTRTDLPAKTLEQLAQARALLDANLVGESIVWLERRQDGSMSFLSAPRHIDALLEAHLYSKFATTLLVPKSSPPMIGLLPEVVPAQIKVHVVNADGFAPCPLKMTFPREATLKDYFENPQPGKSIVLVGSKRLIEQYFIDYTEKLEEQGITMICQGMGGGQGRMEAEFTAAASPAMLLITPYMYEGLEFPADTADRLIIDTFPFDSPSHPVIGRRKDRYRNGFMDYCLPRVEHRLFRLLRSFCRHKRDGAEVIALDKRMYQKEYGLRLQKYLAMFGTASDPVTEPPAKPVKAPKAAKKPTVKNVKKKPDDQLQLPL